MYQNKIALKHNESKITFNQLFINVLQSNCSNMCIYVCFCYNGTHRKKISNDCPNSWLKETNKKN